MESELQIFLFATARNQRATVLILLDPRRSNVPSGFSIGDRANPGTFCLLGRSKRMDEDFSARSPRVLTREQRLARDAKRRVDAEEALREYAAARKAFEENRERLKAERLAREARSSAK
jgi:hypothetical protein